MQIEMEQVKSSMVAAIGYDADTETFRVEFNGGRQYDYAGVPADVFEAAKAADSIGRFINSEIKPNFAASKVDE